VNESATNNAIGQLIEPKPVGYSFNTPGWYLVLGLLILVAIVVVIVQYRKYLKNAYRRKALKQIEYIVQTKKETVVFEINQLLKTMAISLFGREKVASLYGEEWFRFLNTSMKVQMDINSQEITKAIYNTEYQLNDTDKTKLVEFASIWVQKHSVKNV